MKKKILILIVIVVLLLVLFVPIPSEDISQPYDGGSRCYTALTYKIVKWKHIDCMLNTYSETKVYFFPDNFKSMDELWIEENL